MVRSGVLGRLLDLVLVQGFGVNLGLLVDPLQDFDALSEFYEHLRLWPSGFEGSREAVTELVDKIRVDTGSGIELGVALFVDFQAFFDFNQAFVMFVQSGTGFSVTDTF